MAFRNKEPFSNDPSSKSKLMLTILWYICFGVIHEMAHLTTYLALSNTSPIVSNDNMLKVLVRAAFGRYCAIPFPERQNDDTSVIFWVRHSGWVFSLALSICLHYFSIGKNKQTSVKNSWIESGNLVFIAYVTTLEAISTDLFGMTSTNASTSTITLFCGNFGLILLNSQWISGDGGKSALDILEKMVQVTMMRGAQTGGVVTFKDHNGKYMKGRRSRVVNTKRGDLSKGIRRKLQKDVCDWRGKLDIPKKESVYGFFGHTRFATSSVATMDGCHPHQWSPGFLCSFFNPYSVISSRTNSGFYEIYVENYITHNGDFDFFNLNGKNYGLSIIQDWLEYSTGHKRPSSVDSAAVAGMIDILRTQGSFLLSVRYAVCLGLPTCTMNIFRAMKLPSLEQYRIVGKVFEGVLHKILSDKKCTFKELSMSLVSRDKLVEATVRKLRTIGSLTSHPGFCSISHFIDEEKGAGLSIFTRVTINAFFDNDLLMATKLFFADAKGSFGVCFMSSLDASRQVCLGAKGQSMSVAFYPKKGIMCYGSEQAAVKAGNIYDIPRENEIAESGALRIDLDDLSGEISLLDWGDQDGNMQPAVSLPNRCTVVQRLMGGKVNMVLLKDFRSSFTPNTREIYDPMHIEVFAPSCEFSKRMVSLEDTELVQPLPPDTDDPVLQDIHDVPRICSEIQFGWKTKSLNRLTAFNLQKSVQKRMESITNDCDHKRNVNTIDILITGCEVSLWVAEQFASDLKKALPLLKVKAMSSNKLLGVFGQDIELPAIGFNLSSKTFDLHNPICIIVSHSGATFAPLACSNLLQGVSRDIFVVTSDWDTQIGKQLRILFDPQEIVSSRIFSTGCGIRTAEACSLTVIATHQLLTQIYTIICMTILNNRKYKEASGAVVTHDDLEILEQCNLLNTIALEDIAGTCCYDDQEDEHIQTETEIDLRNQGDIWANHVLENAKAYIMSIMYILVTVIGGKALFSGLYCFLGINSEVLFWLSRVLDAFVYIFLPQINVIIIRLMERRSLLHRMVGRTIVIGDIPWVSQCAEAFLSKLFACSFSIASINVMSGNAVDHLVHRYTHRIVRGSLLICGRPDGRLSALTSSEVTVALTVSQASSIQSLGGNCESITIGHNPYKLPLSTNGIFLKTCRPNFLCEQLLKERSGGTVGNARDAKTSLDVSDHKIQYNVSHHNYEGLLKDHVNIVNTRREHTNFLSMSSSRRRKQTNSVNLLASYEDMVKSSRGTKYNPNSIVDKSERILFDSVLTRLIGDNDSIQMMKIVFDEIDKDNDGFINQDGFLLACKKLDLLHYTEDQLCEMFDNIDVDGEGAINFDHFILLEKRPTKKKLQMLQNPKKSFSEQGLLQVEPSSESYFGFKSRARRPDSLHDFNLVETQSLAMDLFESRIASMQRFMAMTVVFHQMAQSVEKFFEKISFGLLSYRIDRTHSIMRVATTASPVRAHEVSEKIKELVFEKQIRHSVATIERFWLSYCSK